MIVHHIIKSLLKLVIHNVISIHFLIAFQFCQGFQLRDIKTIHFQRLPYDPRAKSLVIKDPPYQYWNSLIRFVLQQ